jgi:hypothetical protein
MHSKKKKGGTPTKLTDIPEDLTIKFASKTTLASLKLFNMTSKTYRTQLRSYLTTNEHPNQFHIINENAGDMMNLFSITLNNILNSCMTADFFDKFIHSFSIAKPNEQCKYIYENVFDYTQSARSTLSLFIGREEISKDFLKKLKFTTSIFTQPKQMNYVVDYRIFQYLLFLTDANMKGRAKLIMKISLIKQFILFLQTIYVSKLVKHYPYLNEYVFENAFKQVLENANIHIETYLFDKRFRKNDYFMIENLDIFFFYFYSVIATFKILDNRLFASLSDTNKVSIKQGMIYDMIYYIKSIYVTRTFNYRQRYTILYFFNLCTLVEKDKHLKFLISLVLFKYINHLFERNIVSLDELLSDDIGYIIDAISKTIKPHIDMLPTLEFAEYPEVKHEILLVLAKHLQANI